MSIQEPTGPTPQLKKLEDELRQEVARADVQREPDITDVFQRLVQIGERYNDASATPALTTQIHRRVLGAQCRYIAHCDAPSHLVNQVINELNAIGYEDPVNWADIRVELADSYDRESNHHEAAKVRKLIRDEVRRVILKLQMLKHI